MGIGIQLLLLPAPPDAGAPEPSGVHTPPRCCYWLLQREDEEAQHDSSQWPRYPHSSDDDADAAAHPQHALFSTSGGHGKTCWPGPQQAPYEV